MCHEQHDITNASLKNIKSYCHYVPPERGGNILFLVLIPISFDIKVDVGLTLMNYLDGL